MQSLSVFNDLIYWNIYIFWRHPCERTLPSSSSQHQAPPFKVTDCQFGTTAKLAVSFKTTSNRTQNSKVFWGQNSLCSIQSHLEFRTLDQCTQEQWFNLQRYLTDMFLGDSIISVDRHSGRSVCHGSPSINYHLVVCAVPQRGIQVGCPKSWQMPIPNCPGFDMFIRLCSVEKAQFIIVQRAEIIFPRPAQQHYLKVLRLYCYGQTDIHTWSVVGSERISLWMDLKEFQRNRRCVVSLYIGWLVQSVVVFF